MKKTKSISLALLFVVAVFTNCIPKEEKDNSPVIALLLYANDQLSGNCASVTKTNSTTYTATLLSVPKGGCSQPGTKEEAVAQTKSETAKLQTIYSKAGSNCNATSTAATSTANYLINAYNNMTEDQYKVSLVNGKMVAIGNLVTESHNTLKNAGRTDEQIAAMKPGSLEDYYTMSAVAFATAATQPTCVIAIKDSSTNAGLFTTPPTVVALSSCTYGSSQPATTKCANLNLEF
ncbi:hypothetical protein ND861_14660 [Leptospira sp. 2 VSF19]|uniref:Lipoprotein n=1 Tax=Leptospira soteropolitanensis TaxID=2950025 RepID=A0AAW5VMB4_9LEPT|nr:hypothetical protein [Leptospira soteropolitanensis]MCW7493910.1 hypothetical protein [Leptospira soteropolitanensis]MCW7501504.1 hypothetical protein [Leptospira soteropolitanensis]MCW7523734.1 hypothetical protein [Leptospira soteropolitanensis]MCW7527597.1 hypothetical protein [Leptospira soteropolitanensis]MCW7531451.1 hypothetical protein [Leptospira soteropolitanensis]